MYFLMLCKFCLAEITVTGLSNWSRHKLCGHFTTQQAAAAKSLNEGNCLKGAFLKKLIELLDKQECVFFLFKL